jgi:hypothetical protein
MTNEKKILLWCVSTFMILGSLRPSEILSHTSQEYDPTKCLLAQDLKRLKVKVDGQETIILQLFGLAKPRLELSQRRSLNSVSTHHPPTHHTNF